MDEIKERLQESTAACVKNYEAWRNNTKDESLRENLAESVHELRKIASRLEIEVAISEREQMASKPLPIPPHRSKRKSQGDNESILSDDNIGNNGDDDDNTGNGEGGGGRGRSGGKPRRSSGGGRQRRPSNKQD